MFRNIDARWFVPWLGQAACDWAYPCKCGLCGFLGKRAICSVCEGSFESADVGEDIPGIQGIYCAFRYTDRAAQAVKRLKYERVTSLAMPMSETLAVALSEELPDVDLVVPVPIHASRRRLRGFNQSELLCEAIEGAPIDTRLLMRSIATKPQAWLTPEERRTNLLGAFRALKTLDGERIALVDDVATSGHTAAECAKTLLNCGASAVFLLAYARG